MQNILQPVSTHLPTSVAQPVPVHFHGCDRIDAFPRFTSGFPIPFLQLRQCALFGRLSRRAPCSPFHFEKLQQDGFDVFFPVFRWLRDARREDVLNAPSTKNLLLTSRPDWPHERTKVVSRIVMTRVVSNGYYLVLISL